MSKNETGHAKTIANANLLCTHIDALGAKYNPGNSKLLLANLQSMYNAAFSDQEAVNNSLAPYSLAVDHREKLFAPVSKKITKLRKMYKATEGVTSLQLEDFMTIARKLKGIRKVNLDDAIDPEQKNKQISASQMSYDLRTNNYDLLVSLLQNTPGYSPNETEYRGYPPAGKSTDAAGHSGGCRFFCPFKYGSYTKESYALPFRRQFSRYLQQSQRLYVYNSRRKLGTIQNNL